MGIWDFAVDLMSLFYLSWGPSLSDSDFFSPGGWAAAHTGSWKEKSDLVNALETDFFKTYLKSHLK